MTRRQLYRIRCNTENALVDTWATSEPTTCPNNPAHSIGMIIMLDRNDSLSPLCDIVVDANGSTNYTSIANAFADGNTNVFVKNGTYAESSNIVIPNGGRLCGETHESVIIDLSSGNSVTIDGSGGTSETAGTISIVTDSTTVTGVGTTFTNLSAGTYIMIDVEYFEIGSITNNTSLELVNAYRGSSRTGIAFVAQNMLSKTNIKNLQIQNSSGNGLYMRAVRSSHIEDVTITKNNVNVQLVNCGNCTFSNVAFENSTTGAGMENQNSNNIIVSSSKICNNKTHGVAINGTSKNIQFRDCAIVCNGELGYYISGSGVSQVRITGGVIHQNNSNGLESDNLTSRISLNGVSINHNQNCGVKMDGNSGIVSDCAVEKNGSIGICVAGDNNTISNNYVTENTGNGIKITSTGNYNTVTSNKALSNTASDIVDDGTDTISGNNGKKEPIFSTFLRKGGNKEYIETSSKTNKSVGVFSYPGTDKTKFRTIEMVAGTDSGTNTSSFSLQNLDGTETYGTLSPTVNDYPGRYQMTNVGISPNDPLPVSDSQLELVYNNGGSGKLRLFSFSAY